VWIFDAGLYGQGKSPIGGLVSTCFRKIVVAIEYLLVIVLTVIVFLLVSFLAVVDMLANVKFLRGK